jgi:uncharacterized membrane protein
MNKKKNRRNQINNLPAQPQTQLQASEQKVNSESRNLEHHSFTSVKTIFQGPVPPPELIAAYDAIVPGVARQIFDMAKSQADHRQSLEKKVIDSDIINSKRGSYFAFMLGIIGFAIAAFALYLGHPTAAVAICGAPLVSLVGVFVYGTKSRREERTQKRGAPSESEQADYKNRLPRNSN